MISGPTADMWAPQSIVSNGAKMASILSHLTITTKQETKLNLPSSTKHEVS